MANKPLTAFDRANAIARQRQEEERRKRLASAAEIAPALEEKIGLRAEAGPGPVENQPVSGGASGYPSYPVASHPSDAHPNEISGVNDGVVDSHASHQQLASGYPGYLGESPGQAASQWLASGYPVAIHESGSANPPRSSAKPRDKHLGGQLNIRLDNDLTDRLRRYCFEHRLSLKEVVSKALTGLLDSQRLANGYPVANVDSSATVASYDSHRLMMMMIDDDDQAKLYTELTGNRFSDADAACLKEYEHLGPKCIRLGLLLGRARSRGKRISSLRFFAKIFQEVAAWQPSQIDKELDFREAQRKHRYRW